jgi:hypothetical protein
MQHADPVNPRKPMEIGVGRLGAEEERAAAALVSGGDGSDGAKEILLRFFLFAWGLGLD